MRYKTNRCHICTDLLTQALAHSPTPLLACSENGIYPEPSGMAILLQNFYMCMTITAGAWFYPRGNEEGDNEPFDKESGQGQARYLNSGCLLGRAGQVWLYWFVEHELMHG